MEVECALLDPEAVAKVSSSVALPAGDLFPMPTNQVQLSPTCIESSAVEPAPGPNLTSTPIPTNLPANVLPTETPNDTTPTPNTSIPAPTQDPSMNKPPKHRHCNRQKPSFPATHPLSANNLYPFFTDGNPDEKLWFQDREMEYDDISSNIVDASLRKHLRNFRHDRLAEWAEVVGEKPSIHPFTPFTSAEPGFLRPSQPTSLICVKEIKPPPNQCAPTYGVLTMSPIAKGALALKYRCALSDAHVYQSNKAHRQYALLFTGSKYIRLVPAPLDICLDERVMGDEGRFVRCGCWPNTVVWPFMCIEDAAGDED
ncbi:hypothetical protein FS749_006583 [Ceratobasidium sp. UAMH 11750]|nr:hypothetical protein FS749_006583 [Ceratobasidium sp. UAMH 11750]